MARLFAILLLSVGLSACSTLTDMWPSSVPADSSLAGDVSVATESQHSAFEAGAENIQPEGQLPAKHEQQESAALSAALDTLDQAQAAQLTLAQAWPMALAHDPVWLAATSARQATDTFRTQGLAGLLPQIQAGYSRSRIDGLRRQPWLFGLMRESILEYDSSNAYVQLQQPLFDLGRYHTWRWAEARAVQGDADWLAARQQLAARLSDAWIALLGARDALELRQALADSLSAQLAGQEALFRHNEGNVIDTQQIRSRLETARADAIRAQASLDVAQEALQSMLGVPIGRGPGQRLPVTPQFAATSSAPATASDLTTIHPTVLPPLQPAQLVDWLDMARARNADIIAQRASLRVAQVDVARAASRHAPTLAFVANWSKADSENLSSLSQRTNTYVVGLQLSVPLFSGGYDTALHAQARAQASQASHELDATQEQTLADVMRHYQGITGGAQRIRALESSAQSAALGLEATRKTHQFGLGSNLDTLRMQDRLFNVRAQLNQARLEYLRARIALLAAAGIPLDEIFVGQAFEH